MTDPAEIRSVLTARHLDLSDRLHRVELDRRRVHGPLPPDFADQAQIRENDEVLDRLGETLQVEIDQFRHALDKLDHGHYGCCERCGEQIERARLMVMPQATTCRSCAQRLSLKPRKVRTQ